MSSATVRTQFRSALQAQFPAVEYIETLGVSVDAETLPDLWMTMGFAAFEQQRVSIGSPSYWEESGVVRVLVSGESGAGDAAVVAQADAVVAFFRNYQVPAEMLRVTGVQPPSEVDEESDGKWLQMIVDLFYVRGFYA